MTRLTTHPRLSEILRDHDAGATVATLAARYSLSPSRIYSILRDHRPDRPRAPRRRTSDKPARIQALAAAGSKPARVAELLGCSRAYVYRWWPEQNGAE